MSLKSRFLTLSMKVQIFIAIILLNLFCILVVLSLYGSFGYEILKENYRQKKLYFYDKYKDYIESSYYFQNFCLLQYEEILRRMQKQSYSYYKVYVKYPTTSLDDYSNKVLFYNDIYHQNITNSEIFDKPDLFFLCYWEAGDQPGIYNYLSREYFCPGMRDVTLANYQTMSNTLFLHDSYKFFSLPWYNYSIINSPIFTNVNFSSFYSFNANNIHKKLIEVQGQSSTFNHDLLKNYFYQKLDEMLSRINEKHLYLFFTQESLFFNHMFFKINNEINDEVKGSIKDDPSLLYEYLSKINYGDNTYSLMNYGADLNFFYCEANIINNFLFFLHKKLYKITGIYFIPLFSENNTIISEELCLLFKIHQIKYKGNKIIYDEIFKDIKQGISSFENCFYDNNIINSQSDIKDILDSDFNSFLNIGSLTYQGIANLAVDKDDNDLPFYFIKYTFPNYNALKDFRSDYLPLDQMNFYLFFSFYEAIKFENNCLQFSQNIFYLLIMIILYIWLICLIINLLIYSKVINGWIDPIIKLEQALESNSTKDENIFKYKDDDIINELFETAKRLLRGEMENNEISLKNFKILSNQKEKQKEIDKNIYKKNLIINKDIMNQLINKQQNTMNFSKYIKLNEYNIRYSSEKRNTNNKEILNEKNLISENNNKDAINKDSNNSKENEPYKKLFKISQYLNYYINKISPNKILISKKDKDSYLDESEMFGIMTKNSKNINNFIKNSKTLKKGNLKSDYESINENKENVYINMLDEQSMNYLWYMGAKNENNLSFNYHINDNYDELFLE